MPIYEYRCSSCGFQKEYLQKISDPLLNVCPECTQETFGKMVTAAGFQLKGGGWYVTDFRNSGAGPATKGANGSASKGEAKTESAGESAPKADPAPAAATPATPVAGTTSAASAAKA